MSFTFIFAHVLSMQILKYLSMIQNLYFCQTIIIGVLILIAKNKGIFQKEFFYLDQVNSREPRWKS